MTTAAAAKSATKPSQGLVTWDSEGQEGGPFHSRKLHVPSNESGVTIGRGYDMSGRLASHIANDLMAAGVQKDMALKLAKGAGLRGKAAKAFIAKPEFKGFELSAAGQKTLFDLSYKHEESETRRLATKQDVVAKYGATDWAKLHPAIQQTLVDLKFRGDYTGDARAIIQPSVVKNDLEAFTKLLCDRSQWKNVPQDRFERRAKFLQAELAAMKAHAAKQVLPPQPPVLLKKP